MKHLGSCCFALVLLASACSAGEIVTGGEGDVQVGDVGEDDALVGVDEPVGSFLAAGAIAVGDTARVCNTGGSGLRQRSGPSTSDSILRTMPEGSTVKITKASGVWFENDWGGRVGWSHGSYLCKVESGGDGGGGGGGTDDGFNGGVSRDGAISIAKAAVGFSYWWGGGRFAAGAAHGACYGSCPNCSHSGSYGADCSGFIGKVWRLPEAMPMDSNKHPFSTVSFKNNTTHWKKIARGSTLRADALVYNSNGAGHIVLFEKGDPWGQMWTYEARGCSYGVVHNLRTAGSAYSSIRRDGY